MLKISKIPTLDSYRDLLEKSEYELKKYEESAVVYDMANCILSLNALPEWIVKSDSASEKLKGVAKEKITIMKDEKYSKDIEKLKIYEIDYLLRFVRTFSNHSKHLDKKQNLVRIRMSASFPLSFPIKFTNITIGNDENDFIDSIEVLKVVISFWKEHINS